MWTQIKSLLCIKACEAVLAISCIVFVDVRNIRSQCVICYYCSVSVGPSKCVSQWQLCLIDRNMIYRTIQKGWFLPGATFLSFSKIFLCPLNKSTETLFHKLEWEKKEKKCLESDLVREICQKSQLNSCGIVSLSPLMLSWMISFFFVLLPILRFWNPQ